MRRILTLLLLALSVAAHAAETFMGMYLRGAKIGYTQYSESEATLDGKTVRRSDSRMYMAAGLLGSEMVIRVDSTTWASMAGAPLKMAFRVESGGRAQTVDATFAGSSVLVSIDNSGTKSTKTLDLPRDGVVVDDPLALIAAGTASIGMSRSFYVLDPTTVSFIKNTATVRGKRKAMVREREHDAILVEIADPRATMKVYVSEKGDLIKVEAPMGIEMLPEPREVATAAVDPYRRETDLAFSTSIRPDKKIADPEKLTRLRLRISGSDLARIPSDSHQSTKREGSSWIVEVHPNKVRANLATTIRQAANGRGAWLKPDLHMPSNDPKFVELARSIVGSERSAVKAALRIKAHVQKLMRPNASIAVLRDANDVLRTKEGVCRDYAILTGTLTRAAGIPTRLASGLVSSEGLFFYHAWVEVWDGKAWVGIDSTTPHEQISASHVKLANGTVEQTFTFTFLDNVKVQVLDARRG